MNEIVKSEFTTSAVQPSQYPVDNKFESAFVGRSNVGKSTLINTLTNRRKLARVSSTPGKTRLINFFLINDKFYIVDLPGYGYAKVSKVEQAKWGDIIQKYLFSRPQLKRVILLVDSRHMPTDEDVLMRNWIKHYGYETIVVSTKADKLSKTEMIKNNKIIRETLQLDDNEVLINFSSTTKMGKDKLLEILVED